MNEDLRHYISFVFGQGLRIVFATGGMAILARFLGPDGLGRWAMITAYATLLHLALISWIQQDPLLRFGKPEWVKSHRIRETWSARLPIMGIGMLISILLFTVAPVSWTQRLFLLSRIDRALAFCFLISIIVTIEFQTLFQTTERMMYLAFVPSVISGATFFFYLGLKLDNLSSHRLEISLLGTVFLTTVIWLGAGISQLKDIHVGFPPWNRTLVKTMLIFAWPILPTTMLGYCVNWGSQILIRHVFSSRDVGLYQVAFQVHSLIVSIAVPLTTITLPRLIGRHFEDPTVTKRYVNSIAPSLFCLWLTAAIPLVVILPTAFHIVFGRLYANSVPILTAFLVCTPLCALGQLYTGLYTVQNNLGKIFVILVLMVCVNLAGVWVILPGANIRNFAFAFSTAFVFSQYLTYFYQHHLLKEPTTKIHALLISAIIFSLGQIFIYSLILRLAWGLAGLFLLIISTRLSDALDPAVLERLFHGRLQPVNTFLTGLFINPKIASDGTC